MYWKLIEPTSQLPHLEMCDPSKTLRENEHKLASVNLASANIALANLALANSALVKSAIAKLALAHVASAN